MGRGRREAALVLGLLGIAFPAATSQERMEVLEEKIKHHWPQRLVIAVGKHCLQSGQ